MECHPLPAPSAALQLMEGSGEKHLAELNHQARKLCQLTDTRRAV